MNVWANLDPTSKRSPGKDIRTSKTKQISTFARYGPVKDM